MAGYSPNPLHKKLGLKEGIKACHLFAPDDYLTLLGERAPAVDWLEGMSKDMDFVHIFVKEQAVLSDFLLLAKEAIKPAGMIWISWPKKASKVPTDMSEDAVRETCFPMGLVDVKVCAVDDIWSGLKLVIRKELR
ncbi:DUF3052 family protein [Cohaesibacter gelatinilyticus]|uniref:DUF3052 domain-containing protein n=1 Tax=Cohaesibacter gelatinilyticus TaxID=372072 RepID=A0A285NCT4_9HYPH|nr:DUF3052 family protein [Cohaesibacter gelatinilyticus]SNZ05471.1 Protein of unknown function [Cohaesibacter gelatinilyticus]